MFWRWMLYLAAGTLVVTVPLAAAVKKAVSRPRANLETEAPPAEESETATSPPVTHRSPVMTPRAPIAERATPPAAAAGAQATAPAPPAPPALPFRTPEAWRRLHNEDDALPPFVQTAEQKARLVDDGPPEAAAAANPTASALEAADEPAPPPRALTSEQRRRLQDD